MTDTAASSKLTSDARDFLLREHEALRSEIDVHLASSESYAKWAGLSSAAVWSWLLAHQDTIAIKSAGIVPVGLTLALLVAAFERGRSAAKIGRYVGEIEKQFCLPTGLGWESYLQARRQDRVGTGMIGMWFWVVLLTANSVAWIVNW